MILIVDDDLAMAETCAMLLETHGFKVTVAESGTDALSKVKCNSYELVISDCVMPGISGVELSDRLKADPLTAQLPILLMSASLRCEIADTDSYDAFLRKPFAAEKLLAEVRKLLGGVTAPSTNYVKV